MVRSIGAAPDLVAPVIDSPVSDCGAVIVRNVLPGARVDVYKKQGTAETFHRTVTTATDVAYVEAPSILTD